MVGRPGEQKALTPRRQLRLRRAVLGRYPVQLALPGLVWTRPQVRELVRRWCGSSLSRVNVMAAISNTGELYFICYAAA